MEYWDHVEIGSVEPGDFKFHIAQNDPTSDINSCVTACACIAKCVAFEFESTRNRCILKTKLDFKSLKKTGAVAISAVKCHVKRPSPFIRPSLTGGVFIFDDKKNVGQLGRNINTCREEVSVQRIELAWSVKQDEHESHEPEKPDPSSLKAKFVDLISKHLDLNSKTSTKARKTSTRQFTTVTEADESELNFGKTSEFQYGTTRAPETFRVKLLTEKLSKNDVKLQRMSEPLKKPTFFTNSEITTEHSATEPNRRNSENVEIITSSILNETLTNSTDEITPWHATLPFGMAGIIGIPIAAGIFVAVPVGVLIFFTKRKNKKTAENRRTIRSEDSGLPPITPLPRKESNDDTLFALPSESGTDFMEVAHGTSGISGRWSPSEFDGISESKLTLRSIKESEKEPNPQVVGESTSVVPLNESADFEENKNDDDSEKSSSAGEPELKKGESHDSDYIQPNPDYVKPNFGEPLSFDD